MAFKNFNLHPEIVKAIAAAGYTAPTPIQEQAIPQIMDGKDLLASAQTGTGKTAAFILPAVNRVVQGRGRGPKVLVLVPTRELAMQVAAQARKYTEFLPQVRTICIFGGAPYPAQNRDLSRPYDILVATPGRLIDHMEQGRVNFSGLEMLILDEADRLLDMGFIKPIEDIVSAIPKNRQTLLFSATIGRNVMGLARKLLNNPVEIAISADKARHENIEQRLHGVDNIDHKYTLLNHILVDKTVTQAIIFTATKRQADQLSEKLYRSGLDAAPLHGDMNQRQRTRTIQRMYRNEIRFLVATDVAARGIDVQNISHVINFDLPENEEDYVHRIGRTGRAGAMGVALSFAGPRDMYLVKRIERFTGHKMVLHTIPGMEPKVRVADSDESQPPKKKKWGGKPRGSFGKPRSSYGKPRGSFGKSRAAY